MRYDDIRLLKGLYFHHEKSEDLEDLPKVTERLNSEKEKEDG